MHPSYVSDRAGECPICHMALVKKTPEDSSLPAEGAGAPLREMTVEELMKMKPGEICLLHKCKSGQCLLAMTEEFAKLGKCPSCGEDLGVVVKDAFPQGYSAVKLAADKQQTIDVKTSVVTKRAIKKTVRAVGTVAHDPDLYQAESEYLEALHALRKAEKGGLAEALEQAQRLVASARVRLGYKGLTEEMMKEIETAGEPDQSLLFAREGGPRWIYARVYENELAFVRAGSTAVIEIPSMPGKNFNGAVRAVDPTVDAATRTVRIRVRVDDPEGILKPEMYVNVVISEDMGEILTVPKEAVFDTGTRKIVFVVRQGQVFEPREITAGVQNEEVYEIKRGLAEGETVVTSGNFLLDSESRLKAALESASAGGHVHGQ